MLTRFRTLLLQSLWLVCLLALPVQAQIALPNGAYSESVEDLRVAVPGGAVRVTRQYLEGRWQVNARWNRLQFAYDNLDGTVQSISRNGSVYAKVGDGWVFDAQNIIRKVSVAVLPPAAEGSPAAGIPGQGGQVLATVAGYRWVNRKGDWINYDGAGRISAYGDKNDITVWFQFDAAEHLRYVLDHLGRVVLSYTWTGEQLTRISDTPLPGGVARSVSYRYSGQSSGSPAYPLLVGASDPLGYETGYGYTGDRLTTVTDAEGRVRRFAYSGDRIKSVTEPDGARSDYVYDYDKLKRHFFVRVTGPQVAAGRKVEEIWYDDQGRVIRRDVNGTTQATVLFDPAARGKKTTDARGLVTVTQSDEFDNLVKTTWPDGSQTRAKWSTQHGQKLEETDELGVKTQYDYDTKGNLLKLTEAVGLPEQRVTEYEINSLGQTVRATRKGRTEANGTITPDATWQIEFDGWGKISKTTDPEGYVRQYAFDRAGKLVSYTDPLGNITRYQSDAAGRLSQVTDALSRVRSYQYDKVGNLVGATDARGKSVLMAYDAMNRRTQSTNPVGGVFKLQYDAQGLPIQETDEDGRGSRAEFDNFLRLAKLTDGLGNVTEYGYQLADGAGSGNPGAFYKPTEVKYPSFTQQTRYDARKRPGSRSLVNPAPDGVGSTTSTFTRSYDKRGQIKSETDANGKTRTFSYDAIGQLTESSDRLGNKTQAAYDSRGNLIALSDARGNTTRFEYDRNNRLAKETLPLGQVTQYQYDAVGNLKQRVAPLGNRYAHRHDAANRLVEMTQYRVDGTLLRTTGYTWDATDNLVAWGDTDATRPSGQQVISATLSYDDASRKTGETVTYPSGYSLNYGYSYSPAGRKTQLTWADGSRVGYGYSPHGELETVTISGEGTVSVSQFKWRAPTQTMLPGGGIQSKTYDGMLQLTDSKAKNPGQQVTLSLQHTWGKVFEPQRVQRSDTMGATTRSKDSRYTYDDEIRLTQAQTDTGGLFGGDTETFTLDGVANRIAHNKVSGAWQYDANNRLSQRGGDAGYQYDDNGNLIQKSEGGKIIRYTYDALDRLIEVADVGGGTNKLIARYGYDPMNRRLWKESYRDKDGTLLAQARRTLYLYADEGLIAEASQDITLNTDGTVTALGSPAITTQYGPRPNSHFTTGMLFIKTKNSNGQTSFAYYHHDPLGTPIQATDKAGNVVWAAEYNPFGEATVITPTATADNPTLTSNLRLPGQYYDEETGLHYNWHRYYNPSTGRYETFDPIGVVGYRGMAATRLAGRELLNRTTDRTLLRKYPHVNNSYTYINGRGGLSVDPSGLFGDGTKYGPDSGPDNKKGHSDFIGGEDFDFTMEDHGFSSPINPVSTGRHFQSYEQSIADVISAIGGCDRTEFQRSMHRLQDFYSHYSKGYRWQPGNPFAKCGGTGHVNPFSSDPQCTANPGDPDNPDNDMQAWDAANQETITWVTWYRDNCSNNTTGACGNERNL